MPQLYEPTYDFSAVNYQWRRVHTRGRFKPCVEFLRFHAQYAIAASTDARLQLTWYEDMDGPSPREIEAGDDELVNVSGDLWKLVVEADSDECVRRISDYRETMENDRVKILMRFKKVSPVDA